MFTVGVGHIIIECYCGFKMKRKRIDDGRRLEVSIAIRIARAEAVDTGWRKYNGCWWCPECSKATQLATFMAFQGRLRGAA